MKKTITALVIMMTVVLTTSAQLTIIPKAGITLSKVASEDSEDMKQKLGLTIGVGLNYQINETFSFQPELQFVQKGFRVEESSTSAGITETFKANLSLNYLELPILVKTSFGSDNLKFFLNAGPSLGIGLGGKVKAEYKASGSGISESFSETSKVKFGEEPDSNEEDVYFDNRLDIGLQVGGGLVFASKIMVDIRYGIGLSNLYDKQPGMTSEEAQSQNRVIQFTVGMPITR